MSIRTFALAGLVGVLAVTAACGEEGLTTESSGTEPAGPPANTPKTPRAGTTTPGTGSESGSVDGGDPLGDGSPSAPDAQAPPNDPKDPPDPVDPKPGGGGARSGSNQDCCYDGDYYRCPDTAACFGGFDVDACIGACGGDFACMIGCTKKLSSAPPPTSACKKTAAPASYRCN